MKYNPTVWNQGTRWHCNDTSDLINGSATWYIPVRLSNHTPEEFAAQLIKNFKAQVTLTDTGLMLWSFDSQEDAEKYRSWIKKQIKGKTFTLGDNKDTC